MTTLSEAARTGRRFRRRSQPDVWFYLNGKDMRRIDGDLSVMVTIDAEMLVSTDWESEPLRLELSADDIFRHARNLEELASKRRLSGVEFARLLCVELGLIEESQ